jgi:hypothetical protein
MRLVLVGSSICGTTITRKILSAHNRVWLTNELRIYYMDNYQSGKVYKILSSEKPEEYFKSLLEKIERGEGKLYHALPPWVDYDNFVYNCMQKLKEDTINGRIEAVEDVIFDNKFEYFGDKGADIAVIKNLPDTNVIFIYRDGRDVAFSGARQKRGMVPPWSNSLKDNAHHWACNMENITKNIHNFNKRLFLRFEDFIEYPSLNFDKMSSFLNMDFYRYSHLIKANKSHVGYYVGNWKNWREEATDKTKKMLSILGYI